LGVIRVKYLPSRSIGQAVSPSTPYSAARSSLSMVRSTVIFTFSWVSSFLSRCHGQQKCFVGIWRFAPRGFSAILEPASHTEGGNRHAHAALSVHRRFRRVRGLFPRPAPSGAPLPKG